MGAGVEQIALNVTTRADTRALSQVRQELADTKTVTDNVTVSAKQMSDALKATGGDLQKAAAMLAQGNATAQAASQQATAAANPAAGAGAAGTRRAALNPADFVFVPEAMKHTNTEVDKLNPKLRTAANSMAIISQTAVTGQGSMAGLAMAVGNVVAGLVAMEATAKAIQRATIIGIIVSIGAAIYGTINSALDGGKKLNEELKDATTNIKAMGEEMEGADVAGKVTRINREYDKEIEKIKEARTWVEKLGLHHEVIAKLEAAAAARRDEDTVAERRRFTETQYQRSLAIFNQEEQLAGEVQMATIENARIGTFKTQLQQLQLQTGQRRLEIDQLKVVHDQYGNIKPLTKDQADNIQRMRLETERLLELGKERIHNERDLARQSADIEARSGADNLKTRYEAAIDLIRQQRREAIEANEDETTANITAQNKIRALRRSTAMQAKADAKTITDVLLESNNKSLKAIGTFGDTVRRIIIGAEAARAAVRALHEAGEAIASAAVGDFRGAALHGAASLEFGAAAALGAQESLGGGGGGGSGAGGGGNIGTFTPTAGAPGGGDVHLTIQTVDPTSGSVIQETIWHINRSELLKRPVVPPPQRRSA